MTDPASSARKRSDTGTLYPALEELLADTPAVKVPSREIQDDVEPPAEAYSDPSPRPLRINKPRPSNASTSLRANTEEEENASEHTDYDREAGEHTETESVVTTEAGYETPPTTPKGPGARDADATPRASAWIPDARYEDDTATSTEDERSVYTATGGEEADAIIAPPIPQKSSQRMMGDDATEGGDKAQASIAPQDPAIEPPVESDHESIPEHKAELEEASKPTQNPEVMEKEPTNDAPPLTHDVVIIGPNAPVPDTLYTEKEKPTSSTASDPISTSDDDLGKEKAVENGEAKESKRIPEVDPPGHIKVEEVVGEGEAERTNSEDDANDDSKYVGGFALGILTFGLCMATFVVALDNTIIATAIPRITTQFDSLNDVGWYGSSYLLTTTSLQPSFGKVYTYFNVKWTYIIAILIFEVGSVLCATATGSTMLIIGRATAGAGASALFSGGMTIIGYSVALRKRPFYIAALSSMFGISSVIGPILGGVFTDRLTWRWCFWINLPFGAIALGTVFFFFKNPVRKHSDLTFRGKLRQIDLLGAFLLICGIICLLLALQWGGSTYPWHNSKVWGCILGFGLIIIVLNGLQFHLGDRATIPPRIMTQRTVWASATFSSFLAMGVYTQIFYLPFYFQAVKSTSAEGSGIRTIPYLVSITIASIVVGGSITYLGWYTPFMWGGAAIFTIGSGMLYTLKVGSGAGMWIGYQILTGVGAGASIQIPFVAVQVVLSAKDMPTGNALAIFFNSLGGAISVSVAQNIFSNTLIQQIPRMTHGVDPAAIIAAGATHVHEVALPGQLQGVLEAYDMAIVRAFIVPIAVGGIAMICSFFMEWKSVKGKNLLAGAGP